MAMTLRRCTIAAASLRCAVMRARLLGMSRAVSLKHVSATAPGRALIALLVVGPLILSGVTQQSAEVAGAPLLAMSAAAPTITPTPRASTPTPTPVATPTPGEGSLGSLGPAPQDLAQSWVAGFHLSGHFFHPGDKITGTITVKVTACLMSWAAKNKQCYQGTNWGAAGGDCPPMALECTWKAGAASDNPSWTIVDMPIGNTIGPADSEDYFTVVDKNTFALDGHVLDKAGNPLAGVSVSISGRTNKHLTTDSTGYYDTFLKRGTYTVEVSTGSLLDNIWFRPRSKTVDLQDFATADFTGADHTVVQFKDHSLAADGLGTTSVTVSDLNPFDQPVPSQPLRIDTSGPDVLVCSAVPNQVGRLAPTDLVGGEPLNLAATVTTNAQGTVTLQIYTGTDAGTVDIAADSADATAMDTTSLSHDTLDLKDPGWLSRFPTFFRASYRLTNGTQVHGENLTTLLWADLHGLIIGEQGTGFRELSGSPLDEQEFMLRWLASDLLTPGYEGAPLAGVEIAPVSGPGGTHPAVLIFVHGHRGDDADTRVIDTNVFDALANATSPEDIPVDLPTLSQWTKIAGGSVLADYVQTAPEQGLTYGGFPYLPGTDAALAAFKADCLQKAQ